MSNFTPADALREHASLLEAQAAELRRLAETIEAAAFVGSRGAHRAHARAGDLCDSSIAEKLTGRSRDTLIRAARKNPEIGWKPQSGGWRFSRRALAKHFLRPAENAEFARIAEATPLFDPANHDHRPDDERERNARRELDPP